MLLHSIEKNHSSKDIMAENEINEMEICLTNHPAKQSIDEVMELANIQTIGGV